MNEALSGSLPTPAIRPYLLTLPARSRAALKSQQPRCLWLTGLSGAGKSTLANALELHLHQFGLHTMATICAADFAGIWAWPRPAAGKTSGAPPKCRS